MRISFQITDLSWCIVPLCCAFSLVPARTSANVSIPVEHSEKDNIKEHQWTASSMSNLLPPPPPEVEETDAPPPPPPLLPSPPAEPSVSVNPVLLPPSPAPPEPLTVEAPKLTLRGAAVLQNVYYGDVRVDTVADLKIILNDYGPSSARRPLRASRWLAWTSLLMTTAGFSMSAVSAGLAAANGYESRNGVLFGVGAGMMATGLILLIPSTRLMKKVVHLFNEHLRLSSAPLINPQAER